MATNYPQTGSQRFSAKAFALVLPLLSAACSNREDDCRYTLTCGDFSAGGTTSSDTAGNTGGIVGTGGNGNTGDTGALGGSSSSGFGGTSSASDTRASSAAGGSSDAGVNSDVGGTGAAGGSGDTGSAGAAGGGSDLGGTVGIGDSGIGGTSSDLGGVSSIPNIGGAGGGGGTGGVTTTCNPPCQGQKPACYQPSLTCVQCTGNEYCSSPKPYCNNVTYTCAECTGESQCSGTKPHCDLSKSACVECTGGTQCSGSKPYCDLSQSICVECLDSTDCTSPTASVCNAGTCSPCATNNDCLHIDGKGVCDTNFVESDAGTESGTCVQCTGNDYAACSFGDAGPAQVCDSLRRTCTDIDEHSATACEPCVSDAQCESGKLCVEEKFNNVSVGYFCFFNQGSATNGVTQSCASLAPYVQYFNGDVSIDGKNANICGLAASTCTAMNLYRKQTCAPNGTPDDSLCGVAPGVDSKCLPWASGSSASYYCSVACITSVDCENGLPCKPLSGSTKKFCAFQ